MSDWRDLNADHPVKRKRFALLDGRPIYITGGQWCGKYGLSNWWHWTYCDTGEKAQGYFNGVPYHTPEMLPLEIEVGRVSEHRA